MAREIAIYEDIDANEGFGPQAMRSFLQQAGGQPITVRLNSQGGNVIDGLAIYNLLKDYRGRKTVHVDGMALSIASIIAMAGDEIVVPENAWLMIHNPSNEVAGDGDDLRQMASLLDSMRDQLATVYANRSRLPVSEIRDMMAAETWFTGRQALEAGFCDRTSAPLAMAAVYDAARFRNAPSQSKAPATFEAHVQVAMARGLSRKEAVRKTVIDHPDLHKAFLRAANAGRPNARIHCD